MNYDRLPEIDEPCTCWEKEDCLYCGEKHIVVELCFVCAMSGVK